MTEYKQHPLSAAFPGMSGAEFAELRSDIAANGLHHAITLYEDAVLDGWHRYCACTQAGCEPRFDVFNGTWREAIAFVKSANVSRRHLTPGERAMVAATIANLPASRPNKSAPVPTSGVSATEAGELFGVSGRQVTDARTVIESRDEALQADVKAGKTSVKAAAKQVRASKQKVKAAQQRITPEPQPRPQSDNVTYLPNASMQITVKQWERASAEQRAMVLGYRNPKAALNEQNKGEDSNLIDWAKWSWNPVVGCLHDCPYCYARDIAERFQKEGSAPFANGFVPTLHPGRLSAPLNRLPYQSDDPRDARIFTGSMSDTFGRWVPEAWIEAVLGIAAEARQWEFLMLTKFPKRMAEFNIPENVWMGTTVDCQARVAGAEAAFERVRSRVKWLSVEPMLEPLKFSHLDRFNLLVIGGASRSSKTPRWIPPFEWLADLMRQADEAGCAVFLKSNLYRKEQPFGPRYRFTEQLPKVFNYLGKAKGEDVA
jgi:protein gp37